MTTRNFHRNQPWWFALVTIAVGALPWSLVTPWSAARFRPVAADAASTPGSAAGSEISSRTSAALTVASGFVLFALVFFTLSSSKLVTYLLPTIPALALLAAVAWSTVRGRARVVFPLLFTLTPALLIFGGARMHAEATKSSGEPLARAIAASGVADADAPAVRYEQCYSPGTDFVLGRRAVLVSPRADQTTSVYQSRYRESLRGRGLWTSLDDAREAPPADVIVRPARDDGPSIPGFVEFFRDRRFIAYRRIAPH
jgi:Flp pilus assembly protein protease CpaA